jgi:hypothetical protein
MSTARAGRPAGAVQSFSNQVTRIRLDPELTSGVVEEVIRASCSRPDHLPENA